MNSMSVCRETTALVGVPNGSMIMSTLSSALLPMRALRGDTVVGSLERRANRSMPKHNRKATGGSAKALFKPESLVCERERERERAATCAVVSAVH